MQLEVETLCALMANALAVGGLWGRMEMRMKALTERQSEITGALANGGLPLCARHEERLNGHEKRIDNLEERRVSCKVSSL